MREAGHVLLGALLLTAALAIAEAEAEIVTYQAKRTGDLFPDDDRVDLYLTLTNTAEWTLLDGTLSPGGAFNATLDPNPGTLSVLAEYRAQPACCPNVDVNGQREPSIPTPLDCQDVSYTDSGFTFTLTLCGVLTAKASATGPGTIQPSEFTWREDGWDAAGLNVSASPAAKTGQALAVTVASTYDLTARATASGYGMSVSSSEYPIRDTPGMPGLHAAYVIQQSAASTTNETTSASTPDTSGEPGPVGGSVNITEEDRKTLEEGVNQAVQGGKELPGPSLIAVIGAVFLLAGRQRVRR